MFDDLNDFNFFSESEDEKISQIPPKIPNNPSQMQNNSNTQISQQRLNFQSLPPFNLVAPTNMPFQPPQMQQPPQQPIQSFQSFQPNPNIQMNHQINQQVKEPPKERKPRKPRESKDNQSKEMIPKIEPQVANSSQPSFNRSNQMFQPPNFSIPIMPPPNLQNLVPQKAPLKFEPKPIQPEPKMPVNTITSIEQLNQQILSQKNIVNLVPFNPSGPIPMQLNSQLQSAQLSNASNRQVKIEKQEKVEKEKRPRKLKEGQNQQYDMTRGPEQDSLQSNNQSKMEAALFTNPGDVQEITKMLIKDLSKGELYTLYNQLKKHVQQEIGQDKINLGPPLLQSEPPTKQEKLLIEQKIKQQAQMNNQNIQNYMNHDFLGNGNQFDETSNISPFDDNISDQ
ncbi:Hypothetical_protein [Hexamita inflata]|uniref:Hypothetical_protein n=1 Tax=Hexamita inflata TaxID=28002 RepID=A0AA86QZV7_9EUKA|nr:Hypothetical protein HINF_LOCUS54087 [Hexamita inflata]